MAGESKGVELLEGATITKGKRPPIVGDARSSVYSVPVVSGSGVMGFTNAALFNESILGTGTSLGRRPSRDAPALKPGIERLLARLEGKA